MRFTLSLTLLFILFSAASSTALELGVTVSGAKPGMGADLLMDGDVTTAWVTGVSGPKWIALTFSSPTNVSRIGFSNGHQGAGQFHFYQRILKGRVVYPGGEVRRFVLRDGIGEQVVICTGEPVESLRIVIDQVTSDAAGSNELVGLSEVKVYVSHPSGTGVVGLDNRQTTLPSLAGDGVPIAVADLLREYYIRQATLAEDYAELFAEDVRDKNDFHFEVFKEMQRQRGAYQLLRSAKVDPSSLVFEKIEQSGGYLKVRSFGAYRVQAGKSDKMMEDDSFFIVSKEHNGWKIVEVEGQ